MADRWTHDRGRSEESRRQRFEPDYGRDRWGAAGGYDYGGGARGQEERTFRGYDSDRDDDRERYGQRSLGDRYPDRSYGESPVFGERETGAGYGRNRNAYGAQGGRYYGDPGSRHDRPQFGDEPRFGGAYEADYGRRRGYDGLGDRHASRAGGDISTGYEADRYRGGVQDWSPGDGGFSRFGFGFLNAERRERGRHFGRGPEGYKRSDARISEDIHDRLTDDDDLDASTIQVQVKDAEVILNGKVADRIDKHRAEHIAEAVSGVEHVQNNLRVDKALAHGPHGHMDNDYDRVKSVADGKN